RTGSIVAINTNYFSTPGFASCGLMAGEGEVWRDSYHHLPNGKCSDTIGFTDGNEVSFFDSWLILHGPLPPLVRQVATGMPTVVREGVVVSEAELSSSDYPSHLQSPNPRTGICLHEDRRTVIFIVVDGRAAGRTGMRAITFGRFAKHILGCWQAIMLDGGGSSTMYVRGEPAEGDRAPGVVNRTSDGSERVVAAHLGVQAHPDRSFWRAEYVDQSALAPLRPGQRFELWVRFRNTGLRPWVADGPHPIRLGTDEPMDRPSAWFVEGAWIAPHRPTAVEATTNPGDIGTFRFEARAPSRPGRYIETFAPLVEGITWMRPARVVWEITVMEPPIDASISSAGDAGSLIVDAAPQPPDAFNPPGIDAFRRLDTTPYLTDSAEVALREEQRDTDYADALPPTFEIDASPSYKPDGFSSISTRGGTIQGNCACQIRYPPFCRFPWILMVVAACIQVLRRLHQRFSWKYGCFL
ncbi:MAG: phosphodiester glycosidase family protein, partial [Deltaproteobacteria bacterium]|nr:phosphodiester glycosidase family protein [Deltaproteobacteria bacterium]